MHGNRITAAGTAPVLHRIPFYSSIRRTREYQISRCKDINFIYKKKHEYVQVKSTGSVGVENELQSSRDIIHLMKYLLNPKYALENLLHIKTTSKQGIALISVCP